MSKRILIVEDDKDISLSLSIRLQSAGFEVLTAGDAQQGVTQTFNEKPDMILLDIGLPAGGGFTVADRVRNHPILCHTPIIFLTASKQPKHKQCAQSYHPVAFFEKPYDAKVLIDTIKQALECTTEG